MISTKIGKLFSVNSGAPKRTSLAERASSGTSIPLRKSLGAQASSLLRVAFVFGFLSINPCLADEKSGSNSPGSTPSSPGSTSGSPVSTPGSSGSTSGSEALPPGFIRAPLTKAQELVNQGTALAAKDKFDEAMALYKQALELEPKNSRALFNLGKIYMKSKLDFPTAKFYFEQSLNADPKFVEAWNMHGLACKRMGNDKGTESSFKQALTLDSNCYDALCNLGYFYFNTNRFKESREFLEKASSLPQSRNDDDLAEYLTKLDRK